MPAFTAPSLNPIYFVEIKGRKIRGKWFMECDRDSNSPQAIIDLIRSGEIDPVKILEINEDEGTVIDVTAEFLEVAQMEAAQ